MAQLLLAQQTLHVQNREMFKNLMMAGLAAIVMPAFAAEWMTDLDAAKTKAATENKAVLVDFTGSDWCGYCMRLKKNVFDKPEFEQYAADKFVLVEIDVPNDAKRVGGPEKLAANQNLCQQYYVEGFPTIMVLSPENDVLGGFVGGLPTVEATTKVLDAALANYKKLTTAKNLAGVEKAKALMEVYNSLPSDFHMAAGEMQKTIAALDPENVTGIQTIAQEAAMMRQMEQELKACGRDVDKALAVVNAALPKVTGANKTSLYELKMMIMRAKVNDACAKAETVEDIAVIKAMMVEMLECLPEAQRPAAAASIEKDFAQPEALLKRLKSLRKKK